MSFTEIAFNLVSALGYGGLAIGLIVDSAGVPIPSEVLIPLGGALAQQGHFNLTLVIIIGTLAQLVGALLSYWLGATGGLALVERYGKYVFFSHNELIKTQRLFDRYGAWLTLAGRCLPGVRTYIGYPAGIARMPFEKFFIASLIGSLVWTVFLAILGYQLAGNIGVIGANLHWVGFVGLALLIVGFIWYLKRHRTNREKINEV